jgi:hypothetical protein
VDYPGSPAVSVAYIQFARFLDALPRLFLQDEEIASIQLPPFIIPQLSTSATPTEAAPSTPVRRKPATLKSAKPARKPSRNQSKKPPIEPPQNPNPVNPPLQLSDDTRALIRNRIRTELVRMISTFEDLARESGGIDRQLTRIDNLQWLDMNLHNEVHDELLLHSDL